MKQAKTRDYTQRNRLLIAALVAAVLGPIPVHGSRTVAAVENAWEELGEVTLTEAQQWKIGPFSSWRNAMPSSLLPAQF